MTLLDSSLSNTCNKVVDGHFNRVSIQLQEAILNFNKCLTRRQSFHNRVFCNQTASHFNSSILIA